MSMKKGRKEQNNIV